jgi:8-oxoguanine DNA glycosylase-like protein
MATPIAVGTLLEEWRRGPRSAQPGIPWPRARWIQAFPALQPALERLPASLNRPVIRTVCRDAAADARAAEFAFVAVMAWGYGTVGYGPFRTRRALDTDNAQHKLRQVAETLHSEGPIRAYERLAKAGDARLAGLGPAFGTKFLYFAQPSDGSPKALILDRLVARWLQLNAGVILDPLPWNLRTYARYLDLMHEWSADLGCEADDVEYCIFRRMATDSGSQWGELGAAQNVSTPPRRNGTFEASVARLTTFLRDRPLTGAIAMLEHDLDGKIGDDVADVVRGARIDLELLHASIAVRAQLGRVSDLIHAAAITLALPGLLDGDERLIKRPSLAAGNDPGRPFDLETDRRVAEFKLSQWKGADAMRKRQTFKDLVHLAADTTGRTRELYVVGTRPIHFLRSSLSPAAWALDRSPVTQRLFVERFGGLDMKIADFTAGPGAAVRLINIEDVIPEIAAAVATVAIEDDVTSE